MTERQARWVTEFLACGNATASAVKAGFSVNGASVAGTRMLRNASVQKALQARQSADAARLSLRREDVLAGLLEAVNQARVQSNASGMIAGLREIGKMMGFYAVETKRVELTAGQGATQRRMEAMSDGQLLALIAQGAATALPVSQ